MFEITEAFRTNHAKSVLRSRIEIEAFLAEAMVAGKKSDARSWEVQLRKVNKLIADYGLDRYADRT